MTGLIECGEWPSHEENKSSLPHTTSPAASDWALVNLQNQNLSAFNEFQSPEMPEPRNISTFVKLKDLTAGEVLVCAGASGYQRAFLSGNSASVSMAGSFFQVRTVSLERSLGKRHRSQDLVRKTAEEAMHEKLMGILDLGSSETASFAELSLLESAKASRGDICYRSSLSSMPLLHIGSSAGGFHVILLLN